MKKTFLITIMVLLISFYGKSQIQVQSDGHVLIGPAADGYATLNITPQYTSPGATNLIIGNWDNNTYGLMSLGVHQDYAWIQSFHVKPLNINRVGGNIIFGSESVESVGIGYGMTVPSAKLHVLGTIYATGTITSSDERLKKNISEIDIKNMKYRDIKPVSYNLDIKNRGFSMEGIDTTKVSKIDKEYYKRIHYGFVAQDVKKIFPELVFEDNEGNLAIDYQAFIPILFKMVKDQEVLIEQLNNEIETVKNDCCSSSKLKSASIEGNNNLRAENILFQNIPNPFSVTSTIKFSISKDVIKATLNIYNMNGTQLKNIELNQRGEGSIIINGGEFNAGMYLYALIADGQVIDTKRMILTD
ncbi:MAG TPA: hypothetical protein DCL77_06495 [Prolixibacteraceae bacterium]|jgi:hypothetical protein|nr:hypothetical protein [Prolixibacteraceae bacterium]